MQKICVSGWTALMSSSIQIDTAYLTQLVDICTDTRATNKCDYAIRTCLLSLLRDNKERQKGLATAQLASKLDLAHLALLDDDDEDAFLDQLDSQMRAMNGQITLLDQNYVQLAKILDKQSPRTKERVLELLDMHENKSEMSDQMLESVALVFESTCSREVKESCLRLLSAANKPSASRRVERIMSEKREKNNVDEYKREFFSSTTPLRAIFKEQLHLQDEQIVEMLCLLNFADKRQLMEVKSLDEFVEMVLRNNKAKGSRDFYTSSAFVFLTEQCLITSKEKKLNP